LRHFAIAIESGNVIVLGSYDHDIVNSRGAHIEIRDIQRLCLDIATDVVASELSEGGRIDAL
jgi:hypothetical protein